MRSLSLDQKFNIIGNNQFEGCGLEWVFPVIVVGAVGLLVVVIVIGFVSLNAKYKALVEREKPPEFLQTFVSSDAHSVQSQESYHPLMDSEEGNTFTPKRKRS